MNSFRVVTGTCRLSYVNIMTPRARDGQEPKYSACILIPKTDVKTVNAIKKACEDARLGSAELFGGKVPANLRSPLHDGDGEMPNGGEYGPECKGHWVLNASSKRKPGIVDRNVMPILESEQVYSGMYARVELAFYSYNTQGNKGIGVGLNNVQKIKDGEVLGGAASKPEDVFTAVEDDDDDLGL